ncbi:tyrosine-type recombinase/integrase [Rhizorhapis sp. SPR117]|uniref:tyrosine-type recombinase/integrase n=1 Tax=Rhizorhapis sp. SPR117 TaxID=2912611 RepID=UPI001F1C2D7C|nr:integrase arm-type DNA-binding domain-containing protein [Rhizorhapis sp. SPR117]
MALTDTAIRQAKHGPKPIKLSDERGLFLLLQPSGGKLWRLKYRIAGKEKKLSLGTYPDVSLKDARKRRDEARASIAAGVDPAVERKAELQAAKLGASNTFKSVADEYIAKAAQEGRASVTIGKSRWLLSLMERDIGQRPIAEITPAELLNALRKVESKGHLETARRMRSLAGRIFRYAVATSRASSDPSSLLRGALVAPKVTHHSAVLEPKAVGELLRAIDGYQGQPLTCIALKLTPHVFVRPGELRRAEWDEFDLDKAVWTIPAEKMKMRDPHVVPLSAQALALLQCAKGLSAGQRYVFSSLYPGNRPMSENTINAALRRIGYSGKEMTAHGFRSMASTLLNESGKWNPDAIERALAHKDGNATRGAYHRGKHWEERVQMAQWWSDHLDTLRQGGKVLKFSGVSTA